jgi:hypothetical protein
MRIERKTAGTSEKMCVLVVVKKPKDKPEPPVTRRSDNEPWQEFKDRF